MLLTLLITALCILILCSAFMSATETSFFSLSTMKIRAFKIGKEKRGKLVARLISNPRKLLVTILMLNVITNILVQNVVASIFGTDSGWLLNVVVPLGLTLIFGEVIPKSLALSNNAKVASFAAPTIQFAEKAIGPLRDGITFLTSNISRVMFFFLKKERGVSLDELKVALRTSKRFGFLNTEEAKLVRGYLNLDDDLVKEIMQPRQEIVAFNLDNPVSSLKNLFVEEQCSRIPVYNKDIENIFGIISSSSFFLHQKGIHTAEELKEHLQKPFFVPESTPAKMLLRQFYEREETMAIVVDEYGSLSGLVTLEDLVEIVVGQIVDKRDEKHLYTRAGEDVIIASGKMELSEFEEVFDFHLNSDNNMATIGGWLTEKLGDLPKEGTKFVTDEFLFHVLSSDEKRIRRIYIRKLTPLHVRRKNKKMNKDGK